MRGAVQDGICETCGKSFSKQFHLIEHTNLHLDKTPFMCILCYQSFYTVKDYVSHAENHSIKENEQWNTSQEATVRANETDEIESEEKDQHTNQHVSNENIGPNLKRNVTSKKDFTAVKCSACFKKYPDQTELVKHIKKTHSKNKFKCQLCPRNFDDYRLLISHLKAHKRNANDHRYTCSQCSMGFKSLTKFQLHKKESHNFICSHCNKWYSSHEKLSKHVCFISSNGEPFKCSCNQTFDKAEAFKLHVGHRPYSCCNCSMQFNTMTNLIRHIRTHTKQKPYVCKDCGRGFSQSANLRNHLSTHLGIRAVKCDKCNFSCKTQSGLFKHKKKHKDGYMKNQNYVDGRKTSTSTISCPICKKQFLFKRNVGMHMKIHKKKECLCTECGKVFDSKSKLTTHSKACHGAPSICQTCGKTFASSVLLAAHEKIHVHDKQFTCSICYKMFSIKNYLVQHMKTHNEGKQYSCSKCGKLFKVASSLKYHNKICTSLNITQ